MIIQNPNDFTLNKHTYLAIIISMIGLPLIYVWGTDCGEKSLFQLLVSGAARPHYWSFIFTIGFLEWMAFLIILYFLKKNNESWKTIGLNWHWFYNNRIWLALLLLVPVFGAIFMPSYYNYVPPNNPQFIEVGPASSFERAIFIFASITAGICEEIIFRGYAITRLGKLLKSNWIALIISTICHVFLHGVPDSIEQFSSYFVLGIIFGGTFILMKRRRLEYLILVHFFLDAIFGSFAP